MPYNGSGGFSLAEAAFVPNTTILAASMNNDLSDIASNGLSFAITKDGQTTITANLPMSGFRHTGVGPGLTGGKTQFDDLRRKAGFAGTFGNNAFESWLGSQAYDTQANYINSLIAAGADPDYIDQEMGKLPDPASLKDRYRRIVELDPTQQESYNKQTAIQGQTLDVAGQQLKRIADALSTPLDTSGLPGLTGDIFGLGSVGGNQELANGRIDPYVGLDQGMFDQLRRGIGFEGDFGNNAFESWLSAQPGSVKDTYIQQLRAAGADPDYLTQLGAKADPLGALVDQRRRSADSLYNRSVPQMMRERAQAENKLLQAGIPRGSEAWNALQDDLARKENDFRLGVDAQASNELANLFGLSMANAQLGNSARSQGLQERAYIGNTPINQFSALLGLGQVGLPQATIAPPQVNVNPADYQGAVYNTYNGQLNAANQRSANNNAMWSNLFGLGGNLGAAAILSERKTKTDIHKVGTLDNGLPVYSFRYKSGGPVQIGLMADEVEQIHPEAIHVVDGLRHVDYAAAVR